MPKRGGRRHRNRARSALRGLKRGMLWKLCMFCDRTVLCERRKTEHGGFYACASCWSDGLPGEAVMAALKRRGVA